MEKKIKIQVILKLKEEYLNDFEKFGGTKQMKKGFKELLKQEIDPKLQISEVTVTME